MLKYRRFAVLIVSTLLQGTGVSSQLCAQEAATADGRTWRQLARVPNSTAASIAVLRKEGSFVLLDESLPALWNGRMSLDSVGRLDRLVPPLVGTYPTRLIQTSSGWGVFDERKRQIIILSGTAGQGPQVVALRAKAYLSDACATNRSLYAYSRDSAGVVYQFALNGTAQATWRIERQRIPPEITWSQADASLACSLNEDRVYVVFRRKARVVALDSVGNVLWNVTPTGIPSITFTQLTLATSKYEMPAGGYYRGLGALPLPNGSLLVQYGFTDQSATARGEFLHFLRVTLDEASGEVRFREKGTDRLLAASGARVLAVSLDGKPKSITLGQTQP